MAHGTHLEHQGRPETFDQVIARGFPRADLTALDEAQRVRRRKARSRITQPALKVAGAVSTVRHDQASMPAAEQAAFRNAIQYLVDQGTYATLVKHHTVMSHNMHVAWARSALARD
jgi:hypothetical protein